MRFFKVSIKSNKDLLINKENFNRARLQNKHLFQNDNCYGICPYCDSPIQLLGIIREIKCNPYGKHCGKNIPYVGKHNQQAFEYCPYNSGRKAVTKNDRKGQISEREVRIYNLIREHFDQIIYIIKQDSGLYISNQRARQMLQLACVRTVWQYPEIDEANIPWIFMYICDSQSLFGRYVRENSELFKVLKSKGVHLEDSNMNGYKRIGKVKGKYMNWSYSFGYHSRTVDQDGYLKEFISPVIVIPDEVEYREVWRTKLEINHQRFHNLIHSEKSEQYRNHELIDIANEIMNTDLKADI